MSLWPISSTGSVVLRELPRLYQQHFLLTGSFGFLIHPSIPFDRPNLRIADFGARTGIWLIEFSKVVPGSCQLDGFDISTAQFPPASTLPENISLHQSDILNPLPELYHGQFHIIAVRGMITGLAGAEWDKAVSNLVPLLSWCPRLQQSSAPSILLVYLENMLTLIEIEPGVFFGNR